MDLVHVPVYQEPLLDSGHHNFNSIFTFAFLMEKCMNNCSLVIFVSFLMFFSSLMINLLCVWKLNRCAPECYSNTRSCKYRWRHKDSIKIFLGNISWRIGKGIRILSSEQVNKYKVFYRESNSRSLNSTAWDMMACSLLWSNIEKSLCLFWKHTLVESTDVAPPQPHTSSHLCGITESLHEDLWLVDAAEVSCYLKALVMIIVLFLLWNEIFINFQNCLETFKCSVIKTFYLTRRLGISSSMLWLFQEWCHVNTFKYLLQIYHPEWSLPHNLPR